MEEILQIHLDFQQKIPLTEQIRKEIYRLIDQQVLQPGALLPTVRQLAAQLGVNFNTVARAYRALDMIGCISTRQGRGTYVVGIYPAEQQSAKRKTDTAKEHIERFLEEAEKDGISRREIAQELMLVIRPEHRQSKVHIRHRFSAKKKEAGKDQGETEPKRTPLPRIKSVRVTKRRTSSSNMFHVKQHKRKEQ